MFEKVGKLGRWLMVDGRCASIITLLYFTLLLGGAPDRDRRKGLIINYCMQRRDSDTEEEMEQGKGKREKARPPFGSHLTFPRPHGVHHLFTCSLRFPRSCRYHLRPTYQPVNLQGLQGKNNLDH